MSGHVAPFEQIQVSFERIFACANSEFFIAEQTALENGGQQLQMTLPTSHAQIIDSSLNKFQRVAALLSREEDSAGQLVRHQYRCSKSQPLGNYMPGTDRIISESGKLLRSVDPLAHGTIRKLSPGTKVNKSGLIICNERYAENFASRLARLASICVRSCA